MAVASFRLRAGRVEIKNKERKIREELKMREEEQRKNKEEKVSEEEHQARLNKLREIGLLK